MITFDKFIAKYTNVGIDFDGAYGDQCMDLMHQYILEVLEIPERPTLAAPAARFVFEWFPNVVNGDKFEQIFNTPQAVPNKGDIVFWGTGVGQYGHVAVFIDGDTLKFNSFDQNWPLDSKCHIQKHSYSGVLGWLRVKSAPVPPPSGGGNTMPNLLDKNDREGWRVAVARSYAKDPSVVAEKEIDDAIGSNYPTPLDWLLADQRLRVYEPQIKESYEKGFKDGEATSVPTPLPDQPPIPTVPDNPGDSGGSNTTNNLLQQILDFLKKIFGGGGGK